MGIVVGEMRFVIAIGLYPQRLDGHAKDLDAAIIDKLIAQHLQNMYLFIISGIFKLLTKVHKSAARSIHSVLSGAFQKYITWMAFVQVP